MINTHTITRTLKRLAVASIALTCVLIVPAAAQAVGDITNPACDLAEASPGFHSFLPDCRAYELVSPADSGNALVRVLYGSWFSSDGNHIIGMVSGGYGEDSDREGFGADSGSLYEFSRGPGGWAAESMALPVPLYPRGTPVFPSADLSSVLWEAVPAVVPGEELPASNDRVRDLVVRERGGKLRVIGPQEAPGAGGFYGHNERGRPFVVGASADLSHVLLNVESETGNPWPGDETVHLSRTLYEYGPDGNGEPVLVGVRNHGRPPWKNGAAHVNEGAQLISTCGTAFGGDILGRYLALGEEPEQVVGGTAHAAVSENGELVYFTPQPGPCKAPNGTTGYGPPVLELYVRAAGSQTLDVSEPPLSGAESIPGRSCTGVCVQDENEEDGHRRSNAKYQGASSDGTHVFFISSQPLVDAPAIAGSYLYEETLAPEGSGWRPTGLTLIAGEVSPLSGIGRSAVLSQNGKRVYFESRRVLAETPNGNGEVAQAGAENLYVYDLATGRTNFVAREATQPFDTTADGEYLVFQSASRLAGTNDTSGVTQVFEYDAQTGGVERVSRGQRTAGVTYECPATGLREPGYNCDGNTDNSQDEPLLIETGAGEQGDITTPLEFGAADFSVSESGAVVFASELALTPGAREGGEPTPDSKVVNENVYEFERGNVYLISPAEETSPLSSNRPRIDGIDGSGQDVYFHTALSLVPQDTDTQDGWYDARSEGGFPTPVVAPGCEGEGCQESSPAPAPLAAPQTTAPSVAEATPSGTPPASKPKASVKAKRGGSCAAGRRGRRVSRTCKAATGRKRAVTSRGRAGR
jgi:hypothetical protein